MKLVSDLHLHSRFARACSKNLNIPVMSKYAKIKGIDLLGTGDFQHPKWLPEIKKELTEVGDGIYKSKEGMNFLLTTEISFIYSQGGKGRRIHLVTWAPNFEIVDQITEFLSKKGRIDYDGRPIFGMSCIEYVESLMSISKDIEIIPAHSWTPYFGVFGSKGGFNSLKECFQDQTKHIHAIETGISSTPDMNWRLSQLDNISIVSFSDAHSHWPWRLGREATIFDVSKPSYHEIIKCVRNNKNFETIEFFPEEGKYHYDGHRDCGIVFSPQESKKHNNICPVCKKVLTIGVMNRVEELADRPEGFKPKNPKVFNQLVPLSELISSSIGSPVASKKVSEIHNKLIDVFQNEYNILLNVQENELRKTVDESILKLILQNRSQKIKFDPGYDGVYGHPLFEGIEVKKPKIQKKSQMSLDEF